jgi:hypothetical protein
MLTTVPSQKIRQPKRGVPIPSFQDKFSVGTIHGANMKPPSNDQGAETGAVVEIVDDDNDISALTLKTQDLNEQQNSMTAIGRWAASGVDTCASGPTTNATPAGATGTAPVAAAGSQIPACTSNEGRVNGGPVGK